MVSYVLFQKNNSVARATRARNAQHAQYTMRICFYLRETTCHLGAIIVPGKEPLSASYFGDMYVTWISLSPWPLTHVNRPAAATINPLGCMPLSHRLHRRHLGDSLRARTAWVISLPLTFCSSISSMLKSLMFGSHIVMLFSCIV